MDDIYNYLSGSKFIGKELNYWCQYQIENHTEAEQQARSIFSKYNFRDYVLYELVVSSEGYGFKKIAD